MLGHTVFESRQIKFDFLHGIAASDQLTMDSERHGIANDEWLKRARQDRYLRGSRDPITIGDRDTARSVGSLGFRLRGTTFWANSSCATERRTGLGRPSPMTGRISRTRAIIRSESQNMAADNADRGGVRQPENRARHDLAQVEIRSFTQVASARNLSSWYLRPITCTPTGSP